MDKNPDFHRFDLEEWSEPFHSQGISDPVLSFQVRGDSIWVTTRIGARADSTRVWGYALWDGRKWNSVIPKQPPVYGLFIQSLNFENKTFFSGASFRPEDGSRILPSWNGMDWEALSIPNVGAVTSMVPWEGKLLLATLNGELAQVSGSQVTLFLPSVDGIIRGLTVQNGRLWLRGSFSLPGDPSVYHGFATLENNALVIPNTLDTKSGLDWAWLGQEAFFLDRRFLTSQSDPVFVVKGSGTSWTRLTLDPSVGVPRRLASDGRELYLIGVDRQILLDSRGTVDDGLRVSKWDGSKFILVKQSEFTGRITQATLDKGRLFLSGMFDGIGDLRADNLAMWDGVKWHVYSQNMNPGLVRPPETMFSWNDKLVFAGSDVAVAGLLPASGISAWDGVNWSAFGKGFRSAEIYSPLTDSTLPEAYIYLGGFTAGNGRLYAGGRFDTAGNVPARNVAEWDGQKWSALGEGVPGHVAGMVRLDSNLYVLHTQVGARASMSRWDGESWQLLGDLYVNSLRHPLAVFKGGVWASSESSLIGWNGSEWDTLDLGINGVMDIISHKNGLLLTSMDGRIYSLDGESLDTLPYVLGVNTMVSDGESVYFSGSLNQTGITEFELARWDGSSWLTIAKLPFYINSVAVHGDYLYLNMVSGPGRDDRNFSPFLRWHRKTGTWSKPSARKAASGRISWRVLPCARDCFGFEKAWAGKVYDLHGRRLPGRKSPRAGAAGMKVLKASR